LNSKRVIQVAVCAALIAVIVAGAGLFPAQAVAGQKNKPATLHGAAAIDQLKQDGQYDGLQTAMNQARFNVSRAENTPLGRSAWHAPNPAAGYDAYITETGVSIAVNDTSVVSLNLHSLGYGAGLRTVAPGEVSGDKQTINLMREGGVREWYINTPEGLEQGFTLMEAPGAQQAGEPLRLALQVSEGWRAAVRDDGQAVTLRSTEGQAVDYGKLAVRDHLGRDIPARLTVVKKQVVIEVEDREATYPLTIDPFFSLQQKLLAADGVFYDYLGNAVALDGDTLVVGAVYDNIGANSDQGSAYVFRRNGTVWTFQQQLIAPDGAAFDYFGSAVAISGDTVVAGAWADKIGTNMGQGSAYVFTRSGDYWSFQQKLTASDGAYSDFFGMSVALDGDRLAVGAEGDDITSTDQGSAYVFTRSGGVWSFQQKLFASDGQVQAAFGGSITLDGNTLAVGARSDAFNLNFQQGSVYVFVLTGPILGPQHWTQQQKLRAGDGAKGDFFGYSVALDGDTLAVGAKYDDIGANIDQGSVYVFTRSGTDWMQKQKLTAPDGATYDTFGYSVAISGDTVVGGANEDQFGANVLQGSAYVFTRSGGYWTVEQKLSAYDGAAYDKFGYSVAISGDTVAVGAPGDSDTISLHGAVYVFNVPSTPTLVLQPEILPDGTMGMPYNETLTATGGTAPYRFVAQSPLPPGLVLNTHGVLRGTPTEDGTFRFRVQVIDANGYTTDCEGAITIAKSEG
jgi:hypothetical protein